MRPIARKATALIIAGLTAALAASTASAIDIDPAGSITADGQGVAFVSEGGINIEFVCNFELVGTLATQVADTEGTHAGEITDGGLEACEAGEAELLFGEPEAWELTYAGNTLPATPATVIITQHNLQFGFDVIGIDCLYQGDVDFTLQDEGEPDIAASHLYLGEETIPKVGGSFFCPPEGFLSGNFQLNGSQTLAL